MPSGLRHITVASGLRIVGRRRKAQQSPSDASSIDSVSHCAAPACRHQRELTSARCGLPLPRRLSLPSLASKNSHKGREAITVCASRRKIPISRSRCARRLVRANRSSAHPPAIHRGSRWAQSQRAPSAGSVARQNPAMEASLLVIVLSAYRVPITSACKLSQKRKPINGLPISANEINRF